MKVDLERLAVAAVESFLRQPEPARDGQPSHERRQRRLGGVGAIALGVVLATGARAAYGRLRKFDLVRVAGAVERKLAD